MPVTNAPPLVARYDPPQNFMNSLNGNVWDVEIDQTDVVVAGVTKSRTYLYVAVAHLGIEVLEFLPGEDQMQDRLRDVVLLQTAGNPTSLSIRKYAGGFRDLIVGDYFAGYRILGYNRTVGE